MAKSKDKKKSSGKSKKQRMKIELKKRYPVYIGILVLLFLLFYSIIGVGIGLQDKTDSEIVAEVNGEKITRQELDSYKTILEQQGQSTDDMGTLQNLIDQKLLYQEAKKTTDLSANQTEKILQQQLASQGMTLDDYKQKLKGQGKDYDSVIEDYRKQMVLSQYSQQLSQGINVSDQEAKNFYEENKELISQQAPNSSYEDLKPTIKQQLQQQKIQQTLQSIISNLRENASIDIKEENLNQTQQKQVNLPSGMN